MGVGSTQKSELLATYGGCCCATACAATWVDEYWNEEDAPRMLGADIDESCDGPNSRGPGPMFGEAESRGEAERQRGWRGGKGIGENGRDHWKDSGGRGEE
jgi:hypothetical protein